MPTSFMDLSGELRNHIYELVLVVDHPICPWELYWQDWLNLELLRTNKTIHLEASSISYGQNQFDFTSDLLDGPECTIFAPLRRTGGNAVLIRSIIVNFSMMDDPDEPSFMRICKASKKFLDQLQSFCPNVRTNMIPVESTEQWEAAMCMGDAPIDYSQVVCLIDLHFGAFQFLTEITAMALEHEPDGEDFHGRCQELREDIISQGWNIQIVEPAVAEPHAHDASMDGLGLYDSVDSDDFDSECEYRRELGLPVRHHGLDTLDTRDDEDEEMYSYLPSPPRIFRAKA